MVRVLLGSLKFGKNSKKVENGISVVDRAVFSTAKAALLKCQSCNLVLFEHFGSRLASKEKFIFSYREGGDYCVLGVCVAKEKSMEQTEITTENAIQKGPPKSKNIIEQSEFFHVFLDKNAVVSFTT